MRTLRLFTLAIAFILFGNLTNAQWVSIPDVNFGNWLFYNGYDQCLQGDSVAGWEIDTTCNAVVTETSLYIVGQNVYDFTGIEYFDNLGFFDCRNNKLTTLPSLPPNLNYLDCSFQDITFNTFDVSTVVLPEMLSNFICRYNDITALPDLPAGLLNLTCNGNMLTALPALPAGLSTLECGVSGTLTGLPTLPSTITYLSCTGIDNLTGLPPLPASLYTLQCHSNPLLTSLPALPAGLTELFAWNCGITQFPAFPNSLLYLVCNGNNHTTLPTLPANLKTLYCSGSQLSSLPAIPNSVTILDCAGSPITSLPSLPDSLGRLNIAGCTNLSCLPQLKTVTEINLSFSGVTCLPNLPLKNVSCTPALNTLGICNYFNGNGCNIYYNITGKVFEDANGNCVQNTGESSLAEVKVQLWQNGTLLQQQVPAVGGFYSFDVTTYGTYQITVDTVNSPFRIKCPLSGSLTSVITAVDSTDFNMDFALQCKPGFDLEAKSIATNTIFRPANFNTVEVAAGDASNFYNGHCAAGVSGTVTLSFTGPVKYVAPAGGALTPSVTGNTLTYNIANFGTVNFFEDFDIITQTDTTAQAGQQICFALSVTPTSGDNNPANNTFNICYAVVNSFDPNDKAVYPDGNIDTAQRDLVYTIRFQNTGNAEAQHIYITDTLSSSINPASFQLLAYSHQPMVQLDGNKLRFNFANINLPDSTTNEPASHGYVQFKVKLNNGLPVGTIINNTAYIYFDFNAPVITNTTTNTIYIPKPPVPVSIGKYRIDRAVKPNGRL